MGFQGSSPKSAPNYTHYRSAVETADNGGPYTNHRHGINMSGYGKALIQVVPAGTANPTINVHYWSEGADRFVKTNDVPDIANYGMGEPFEFTIDCHGRLMYIEVTDTVAGGVDIYVSGIPDGSY